MRQKTFIALLAMVLSTMLAAVPAQAVPRDSVARGKTPSAPLNPHWELPSPMSATPVWDPPAKTGGKPITGYVLTLHTIQGFHYVSSYHWRPEDVGINHFGCLGNGEPEGVTTIWYFTVAAENVNGVGPESKPSEYFYGNPCEWAQ